MPDPKNRGDRALTGTPLHAFSGGFLWNRRVRRILALAGYDIRFGLPKRGVGSVAVWGRTSRSWRADMVAKHLDASLVHVEDPFLRSVKTGRSGAPPLGLVIDQKGAYFDCTHPSDLEDLLNFSDLGAPQLKARAKRALALLQSVGLSKYNAFDDQITVDQTGYVLVIDQTRNDASIQYGGASSDSFAQMLVAAKTENPNVQILIKSHPETVLGHRKGHFSLADTDKQVRLITTNIATSSLLKKANKVYCVTSLMGFEAIISGHRPRIFGTPFYGGWGLSDDVQAYGRRHRTLNISELFAATMLLYPTWFDPYRNQLCDFETAVTNLKAQADAFRQDQHGYTFLGMRLWKRRPLRRFFSDAGNKISFASRTSSIKSISRPALVWAGKETNAMRKNFAVNQQPLLRLEDGFLRSRGLGAKLVPPMSLVVDDLGIYYDPGCESRLERLLNSSANLEKPAIERACALRALLIEAKISKYNVGEPVAMDAWPINRQKILVPGQVEDDASIMLGAGDIRRNIDLLRIARQRNPDAFIVYKPHPDVEAGLRTGKICDEPASQYADAVLTDADSIAAIHSCDEIWTMTSLLGFEALIRSKKVTCLGLPFYAGWGLTTDIGPTTKRRTARPSIAALVYCTLIAYPRYFDPKTGLACPVEVIVERLKSRQFHDGGAAIKSLSKLQGAIATIGPFWR